MRGGYSMRAAICEEKGGKSALKRGGGRSETRMRERCDESRKESSSSLALSPSFSAQSRLEDSRRRLIG